MISDRANVFESSKLGKNVKVGAYAEVGRDVVVGDNTNISAGVFIPELGIQLEYLDEIFTYCRCKTTIYKTRSISERV